MHKKIDIDKDLLEKYVNSGMTHKEIANIFNVNTNIVDKRISEYGIKKPFKHKEIKVGEKYGRLTAIEKIEDKISQYGNKISMWRFKCDCGNICEKDEHSVRYGNTRSCGCLHDENLIECNKKYKKKYNTYDLSGEYGIGWTSNTNKEFYFDLEDYDKIKEYCWNESPEGYILSRDADGKRVSLQRIILSDTNTVTDHIYHNTYDNRKKYLRIGTNSQNSSNRKIMKNNKSTVTGVRWHKRDHIWESYITKNYKTIYLGRYDNFEDAVAARKSAEEKYFGEWSYDNSMKLNEDVSIKIDQEVMI